MIRMSAAAAILLLTAAPLTAQSIGEPLPGRRSALEAPNKPVKASPATRPCPEYGPGFVRVEGASACVRIGGAVRADFGKRSQSGYDSSARAAARLELRGDTALGPARAVVQGRVQTSPSDGFYR